MHLERSLYRRRGELILWGGLSVKEYNIGGEIPRGTNVYRLYSSLLEERGGILIY